MCVRARVRDAATYHGAVQAETRRLLRTNGAGARQCGHPHKLERERRT